MGRLIALALLLWSGAAAADWQYGAFDNGAWFEAHASHASGEIALHCGGPSPQGLPLPQTDEPMMTRPYRMQLTLAQPGLGGSVLTFSDPREDLRIVSDSARHDLPAMVFDELNGSGWMVELSMGDPLVPLLSAATVLAVDDAVERRGVYGTDGLAAALIRLIAFCDARWSATGHVPPAEAVAVVNEVRARGVDTSPTVATTAPAAAPALRPEDPLWQAAQAHIAEGCAGAAASLDDGYARLANLDGDGSPDIVIAWESIECAGPIPRPFCGAAQCAVDVFVSSAHAARARPETIYAQGISIVPGPQGRDLLQLAGRLATCEQADAPPDCLFLWGWADGTLVRMN